MHILWVGLGSALGGILRYLVGVGLARWLGTGFPYGTLAVNVAGSFLISFIMQLSLSGTAMSNDARLFLTTGLMGGLTTYSTFNYESLRYLQNGHYAIAAVNMGGTVFACLVAGVLGLVAARLFETVG